MSRAAPDRSMGRNRSPTKEKEKNHEARFAEDQCSQDAPRRCRLGGDIGFGVAVAAPKVGAPAPDFSVVDTAGETWTLGGLAGKKVILEWTNHDCPFVVKHYASGNMQALQKEATDAGYVWLSVISSASGKQGHVSPAKADDLTDDRGAAPTAVLLDTSGAMGRAYDAKTTPHMYIIDDAGDPGVHGRHRRQADDRSGRHRGREQLLCVSPWPIWRPATRSPQSR
jgi:peroxiredoxin